MTYQNIWEGKGLYRHYEGNISGAEVLESNLSIQGDARFDGLRYIVNDFRNIEDFEVSEADISKIAAIDIVASKSNSNIRIAIVATNEALLKWINLYCDKMKGSPYGEINVYNNIDDAYEWASQ